MCALRAAAAAPRRRGRRRRRCAGPSTGLRPGGSRSGLARSGVPPQTRCRGGRTAEQRHSETAFDGQRMCSKLIRMQLCHLNSIVILPWQRWQIVFAERVGTYVGVRLQSVPALPRCVREIAITRACISPDAAESLRRKSEC